MKLGRVIFLGFFFIASLVTFAFAQGAGKESKLFIFFSPGCHKCMEVKERLVPGIKDKFKGMILVEYYDISDIENYKLLLGLRDKYSSGMEIDVPVFYLNSKLLNGKNLSQQSLDNFIAAGLGSAGADGLELPKADIFAKFRSLKLITIISAGLIDGINPCAFTVIVFFMSFLALQGYRKRELAVIGASFILAVFLTYVLIGLGVFGFFFKMEKFRLVSRVFNLTIGSFSIIFGCLALNDFFKFRKSGKTEELALQLPKVVKNQIHKVIGMRYRINKNERSLSEKKNNNLAGLIVSALVTGFLVCLLEAVCTGQTYLPTITFILKYTNLKLHALVYLLLYNIMFTLPLFVIFVFALMGTSSEVFSGVLKKNMLAIKIFMAILFFGFGIFLIWRA